MTVRCTIATAQLPGIVEGKGMRGRTAAHLASCLRCQAEAARYRLMARELRSLADLEIEAPTSLAEGVNVAIDVSPPLRLRRRIRSVERAVATGAVVAIAGTVAVLGWRKSKAA